MASITEFNGKYEKEFNNLGTIGHGDYSVVFKSEEIKTRDLFAIKKVQIKGDKNQTKKEIEILCQLKSPFVVNYIHSWYEERIEDLTLNTYVYIQMELCSQNLKTFIALINTSFDDKFKTIKYFIRSELLVEIIECFNYLNLLSPKPIQRDLKPENVLVSYGTNGRILKLCDFGLSKPSQSTRGGGYDYMAPEITYFDNYSQESSKIYSLGVIATKLFDFKGSTKTVRKLINFDQYSAQFSNPSLSEKFVKLVKVIVNMVSKTPSKRPECPELLTNSKEWTVDPSIVTSDENYNEFLNITQNNENFIIFKKIAELKLKSK